MKPTLPIAYLKVSVNDYGCWVETSAEHGEPVFFSETVQRLIDAAYEAGKADAREWLPIESAPRDGSIFLGYLRGDVYKASVVPMVGGGERWVFGPQHYGREMEPTPTPTHWMPLPPPPEKP